jgi:hypothetical protein
MSAEVIQDITCSVIALMVALFALAAAVILVLGNV